MRQQRATNTRQAIIDAAVELFAARGYANTGLNDITTAVGITTGAFYHHFPTKEALTKTIITDSYATVRTALAQHFDTSGPGLERLITATFAVTHLLATDTKVRVGHHLNQAFYQLNEVNRLDYEARVRGFADIASAVINPDDIRNDITAADIAALAWTKINGCHMLARATAGNPLDLLATDWLVSIRGIVPDNQIPYFQHYIHRTAKQYR